MRTRFSVSITALLLAAAIAGCQGGNVADAPAAPTLPTIPTPMPIPPVASPAPLAGDTADPFARQQPPAVRALPDVPDSDEPVPPLIYARNGQIYATTSDRSAPQQITSFDETTYAEQPAVSADGSQIAFVGLVQPPATDILPLPRSTLFLINRDGSGLRELWAPEEGILFLPSWAPDGSAVYLLSNTTYSAPDPAEDTTGVARLAIVRVDVASGATEVVRRGALDPSLSADGAEMVFLNFGSDGIMLHLDVAPTAGGEPRRVVDGSRFTQLYAPRFSPDGKQILFAAVDGPEVDENGVPIRTTGVLGALAALFAPPTAAAHGAPWDLWVVDTDGSNLRRLTWLYEDLPMGAYAPDGSAIAVIGYNGLYLMNPDGSNLRRVVPDDGHSGGVAWPGR